MKIYMSADMEGLTGVTLAKELKEGEEDFPRFRKIMTEEVNAAIKGALEGGADEILVNDSHAGMRNLLIEDLRSEAELISGNVKEGSMMEGLDETCDGVFCIGYHAMSGTENAVRAHTYSDEVFSLEINEKEVGELGMNSYFAGSLGIPVAMVSGDDKLEAEARKLLGNVRTAVVKKGISVASAQNKAVERSREIIKEEARKAVEDLGDFDPLEIKSPGRIRIRFKHLETVEALKGIPSVNRLGGYTIEIKFENFEQGYKDLIGVLNLS